MNERRGFLLFVGQLVCVCTLGHAAEKGRSSFKVPTEPAQGGGSVATVCCTPRERFASEEVCAHVLSTEPVKADKAALQVKQVCDNLKQTATVGWKDEWIISNKSRPAEPLFLINCATALAWPWPIEAPSAPSQQPSLSPSPVSEQSQVDDTKTKAVQGEMRKVKDRLDHLEDAFKDQLKTAQKLQDEIKKQSAADRDFQKQLEGLKAEILEKVRTLEEVQKNSCYRIDDRYQGKDEVTIAVAGGVLRFLKIQPQNSAIPIGLAEAKADELQARAQAQSTKPLVPQIYLAVPEAIREVQPFFLQDRLIDPQLYSRLTNGKDAYRVAHQDVTRFITELNARCAGRAEFVLPSEEQFVAAARQLYGPISNELTSCEALRKEDGRPDITELLGYAWQLTRSLCQPFGERFRIASCPDNSFIRKGGAASSTNPLECLPEYRSPAPPDVAQKETSFRLALKE